MFGEVEITHDKLDEWIAAFGPDEKIPVTRGHIADPENLYTSTDVPALCWISGLMKAGDLLLGNFVDWTSEGLEAVTSGGYKNPSIETKDGSRLRNVALLGARTPAVDFHGDRGRFAPLDMAGGCLGEGGQVLLAERLETLLPDDDKHHKTKQAAEAAKGDGMSFKEKAIAALKDVAAKLEGEPEEAVTLAANAPVVAAAPPVAKPENPEVKALAAKLEELDKQVKDQAAELQMAGARTRAAELCRDAHLAPKFEGPLAEYMAGKAEITLAEPTLNEKGEVVKEYKANRNEFFAALLAAKGTAKLDDPKKLGEPPAKVHVEAAVLGNDAEQAKLQALAAKADALSKADGIPVNEAMKNVLAAEAKGGE